MSTVKNKGFQLKDEHNHVINSHETWLVGFNKEGQVIFFKSYHYPTQKEKAQRDVKLVQKLCSFYEFGAASEFKIKHEDKEHEIIIPHP